MKRQTDKGIESITIVDCVWMLWGRQVAGNSMELETYRKKSSRSSRRRWKEDTEIGMGIKILKSCIEEEQQEEK
jgi:hypothetical protein